MASYKKRVKQLQNMQMILVIVCVIALLIYSYFMLRPKVTEYNVNDECGPIGGRISHTIAEDDMCRNACTANCVAWEKEYHDHEFIGNNETCNICTCYCKE
jgi:hypothetical protein